MATRMALVACIDATEGPWTLAKGNETGIKIVCLGEGERVGLRMEVEDVSDIAIFDSAGSYPFPWQGIKRYRVVKEVDDGVKGSPTTVEIILNV